MAKKKPTEETELTPKQQSFVINYIRNGFNSYKAAIDAGYTENTAKAKSKYMLTIPSIRGRLQSAFDKSQSKIEVSFNWRIKKLKRVIDFFIPDHDNKKSDYENALQPHQVNVALRALAEINRMYGDYAPDKRLQLTVDTTKEKLIEAKRVYEEY